MYGVDDIDSPEEALELLDEIENEVDTDDVYLSDLDEDDETFVDDLILNEDGEFDYDGYNDGHGSALDEFTYEDSVFNQ